MFRPHQLSWLPLALAALVATSRGDEGPARPVHDAGANRVYGEWRIQVKPDNGPDDNKLIEQSGLPLFREADGRLVEHVQGAHRPEFPFPRP
jgi:hypothetical protein